MKVILLSILLCSLAFSVYGLNCYSCKNQSACEADDDSSNNCTATANGGVCVKVYTDDSDGTTLMKGCGSNTTCDSYTSSNSSIACTTCDDEDWCNSADSTRFSLVGASLIGFTILRNVL